MNIFPKLEELEQLAQQGNMLPLVCELPADLETPVSVYLKLQDEGPAFLLESISGGEALARYSFIGVRPRTLIHSAGGHVFLCRDGVEQPMQILNGRDPLSVLKDEMQSCKPVNLPGLPRFSGGAVGFLSYDTVRYFEQLPATAATELQVPDAVFMLTDTLVAFDHARQRLLIMAGVDLRGNLPQAYRRAKARIEEMVARLHAPLPAAALKIVSGSGQSSFQPESNFNQAAYEDLVRKAQEQITAGEIFQVVLSQRFSGQTTAAAFDIYRSLRSLNPSPYMVFLRFPGGLGAAPLHVIAASPEMHVRLEDGVAQLRPIAGTRPRGATPAEDETLEAELLADEKERAEHVMLVDLGRNDLGRVCEYGSVRPVEMMMVERYSHVMHIVSSLRGRLRGDCDAFDLLRATFPHGTVSGAPKVRAMEIIEELEKTRRGIYAGVIAYIDYDGNMDSCIALRTMVMQGNTVYIQAGGGIVADSIPAKEYEETLNKSRALVEAVRAAEMEN